MQNIPKTAPLFFATSLACILAFAPVSPSYAGRVVGGVEAGFDSFEEKYSIVDSDTLDEVSEFRTRLHLGYRSGSFLSNYFYVEGRTIFGDGSVEPSARLRVSRNLGSTKRFRIGGEFDITKRVFQDSTSYEFPNDFTRFNGYGRATWKINRTHRITLSDRIEIQNFDTRTEFDYDYTRNSVSLAHDWDPNYDFNLRVAGRWTHRNVPDSTEISYNSVGPTLEARWSPGLHRFIHGSVTIDRRVYSDPTVRSEYTAILASMNTAFAFNELYGLVLEDQLEHYNYDTETGTFFDYTENRAALLVATYPSAYTEAFLGPTFATFRSGSSADDEYTETGVKARCELLYGARIWASASYEFGKRTYPAFANNAGDVESVFSDYTYNRVSLIGHVQIWKDLSGNIFLDYQPEDHEREGDDATATLFSGSLSYRF